MNTIKKIAIVALLFSIISIGISDNASTTTTGVQWVVNNTNLAPLVAGHGGTGERIGNNTIYWANNSPIQILLWAHANISGQNSEIHLYINGTKVADTSGRPLGIAESSNRTIVALIPRYASYMVEFNNYHHYEWREYPILSGRNSTLSINLTNVTNIISGSGVSDLANLTINTNKSWRNYSITNLSNLTMTGNLIIISNNSNELTNITYFSNAGILASRLDSRGLQYWNFTVAGSGGLGHINYVTPGGSPGIVFELVDGTLRSDFKLKKTGNIGHQMTQNLTVDKNITITGLTGTGTRPACIDSNGNLVICP